MSSTVEGRLAAILLSNTITYVQIKTDKHFSKDSLETTSDCISTLQEKLNKIEHEVKSEQNIDEEVVFKIGVIGKAIEITREKIRKLQSKIPFVVPSVPPVVTPAHGPSYFLPPIYDVPASLNPQLQNSPLTFIPPVAPTPSYALPLVIPVVPAIPSPDCQKIAARAAAQGFIHFYDDHTDPLTGFLGNFHKCVHLIEFGGKNYSNSEAIFQSQKFIDQPVIFAKFTGSTTGAEAVDFGKTPMSGKRLAEWNAIKDGVMMHALRAKFSQNSELKDKLLATGSAWLVEHQPDCWRSDKYWSDGGDGTGGNGLGKLLMRLRGEYGGIGEVSKVEDYLTKLAPKCALASCTKSAWFDPKTKEFSQYCSKTCRDSTSQQPLAASHSVQYYPPIPARTPSYVTPFVAPQIAQLYPQTPPRSTSYGPSPVSQNGQPLAQGLRIVQQHIPQQFRGSLI